MNVLVDILNKPYPNEFRSGRTNTLAIIGAVCVALTLFIFQPFGLSKDPYLTVIRNCCVFGSITYLVIFFTGFVENKYLQKITEEEQWTIKKEILTFIIILLIIGSINIVVSKFLLTCHLHNSFGIITGLFQTVVIGIVPITAITLAKHIKLVNRYAQEAKRLEEELSKKAVVNDQASVINTIAETMVVDANKNNSATLIFDEFLADSILLISAADNYIKIYYQEENGIVQSSLKRLTMKNAEDILCAVDKRFFRCHRAYIVRLDKVEHIAGNAQGYKLQLPGLNFVVPVSRTLNNIIADKIKLRNSLLKVA